MKPSATTKNTIEARQGENKGKIYILGLSMVFVIIAFAAVYGFTMMFSGHQ